MNVRPPQAETQNAALLDLLRRMGAAGVTPIDALNRIGSFRLGARVWDLRNLHGYTIDRRMVRTPGGARVACYVLRDES